MTTRVLPQKKTVILKNDLILNMIKTATIYAVKITRNNIVMYFFWVISLTVITLTKSKCQYDDEGPSSKKNSHIEKRLDFEYYKNSHHIYSQD
jgi:hypothetical protein